MPVGSVRNGVSDPVIRIVDAETFEYSGEPLVGHESGIEWIEMNPTQPLLVTQGREQTARVWNLDQREQLGRPLPNGQAGTVLWSPNGTQLAVPEPDGYTIWNFDTDTWVDIACEFAGRNLTREEWDEFGPRTIEYRATCPDYPLSDG